MFTGLSAFPLTPTTETGIDEPEFAHLVSRLATAGVDSIGALGSTGCYPYLTAAQRARAARIAVQAAGEVPVMIGIGAPATRDVLAFADDAQAAGAAAVMLAPVSYHPLTDDEVFGLYADVAQELSVPLCVYDNPRATHFVFTDELHARVATLPNVGAVKVPGVPADRAPERIAALRRVLPGDVALGVSGDRLAAAGLNAGAEVWFSVLGGLLPELCLAITRAAVDGRHDEALALSGHLDPLWTLVDRHGGLRVASALAEHLGLVTSPTIPRPVRGLPPAVRRELAAALDGITDVPELSRKDG